MSNKKAQKPNNKDAENNVAEEVITINPTIFNLLVTSNKKGFRKELQLLSANGVKDFSTIQLQSLLDKANSTRTRISLPEGLSKETHKPCTSCFQKAIDAGKTPEGAKIDAAQPLAAFGTVKGKVNTYCKACNGEKSKKYTQAKLARTAPERAKAKYDKLMAQIALLAPVVNQSATV